MLFHLVPIRSCSKASVCYKTMFRPRLVSTSPSFLAQISHISHCVAYVCTKLNSLRWHSAFLVASKATQTPPCNLGSPRCSRCRNRKWERGTTRKGEYMLCFVFDLYLLSLSVHPSFENVSAFDLSFSNTRHPPPRHPFFTRTLNRTC